MVPYAGPGLRLRLFLAIPAVCAERRLPARPLHAWAFSLILPPARTNLSPSGVIRPEQASPIVPVTEMATTLRPAYGTLGHSNFRNRFDTARICDQNNPHTSLDFVHGLRERLQGCQEPWLVAVGSEAAFPIGLRGAYNPLSGPSLGNDRPSP